MARPAVWPRPSGTRRSCARGVRVLAEQMGQDPRSDPAGGPEGLDVAELVTQVGRSGWTGRGTTAPHRVARAVGEGDGRAPPEVVHLRDPLGHLRRRSGTPPGSARSRRRASRRRRTPRPGPGRCCPPRTIPRRSAAGDAAVPRHCPPGSDTRRRRGDRRTGHRRVRIGPPEGVEMAFRGPHRRQAVLVGEAGAFEQQPVPVGLGASAVVGEIEQAEIHSVFSPQRVRVRSRGGWRTSVGKCARS